MLQQVSQPSSAQQILQYMKSTNQLNAAALQQHLNNVISRSAPVTPQHLNNQTTSPQHLSTTQSLSYLQNGTPAVQGLATQQATPEAHVLTEISTQQITKQLPSTFGV